MDVTRLRQALPVTRKVVYLNTGWSGPSPRAVTARVKKWLDFEVRQGPTTPRVLKAHHQAQDEARQAVARLIGA